MIVAQPKIKYDCDILIVGGGPAGSGLAFHLAKQGMDVLVVEAGKFPRDKVCGDGVSPIALKELQEMGITETKDFKESNEITQVGLHIHQNKAVVHLDKPKDLPYHARIIPRKTLDHLIHKAAKKEGAKYLENTRFNSYTADHHQVISELSQGKKKIKLVSRLVVGADGGRSTVSRLLRGTKIEDAYQLVGLRAYYKNINGPNNRVDIYFSEENFPGIYWCFPKGKKDANIGMAMVMKTTPKKPSNIRKIFENQLSSHPDLNKRIGKGYLESKIDGWPITFYNRKQPITGNRVMLIGEAAGLINPLSGDGIQYALLSARWAAESILKAHKTRNFSSEQLHSYTEFVKSELDLDFMFSNLLVHFPRNKSLSKVWMMIVDILISKSKKDPAFAKTVAGIFEGTYPSHKALSLPFISKLLIQAGINMKELASHPEQTPISSIKKTSSQFLTYSKTVLNSIAEDPNPHGQWLIDSSRQSFSILKELIDQRISKNS